MDSPDSSVDSSAVSPAKKNRKVTTRRTGLAVEPDAVGTGGQAEAPATAEAPFPAKRGRPRRVKAEAVPADDAGPELFSAAPVIEPSPVPAEPVERAVEAASAPAKYAPYTGSFSPDDEAPREEAPPERPVFVPSVRADAGSAVSGSDFEATGETAGNNSESGAVQSESGPAPVASAPGFGGAVGPDGQPRREERKTWWERKKEKKRLKWLERQQGGPAARFAGAAGSPPDDDRGPAPAAEPFQAAPGAGGPGFAPGRAFRDRDRPPIQPPPPVLSGPIGGLPDPSRFSDLAAVDALAEELAADMDPLDLAAIHAAPAAELAAHLRSRGEVVPGMPARRVLVEQLFAWTARERRAFRERGVLDLTDAGHGFVVHLCNSYRLYPESTYVSAALVRRHGLRRGQEVDVLAQPPRPGERCPSAVRIVSVMGLAPEQAASVTAFEELIPYYPTNRILLEANEIHKDISMRAVDLLTPVGFGQRGLIVAPPRTGKTVLLQNIANSISRNFPEATLILLLIDERPEEVTDFRRHTKGDVISSTFDETPESHAHAAEMVIERARRLVELGKHVVILLDSITRLARAYNALAGNGGKTMSGGIESNALQRPKRFFGSARNIEGGGSLTILGTALVDTNSRMDEVIFEEFKGTGNMELHLDRGLSDKRIFPAINIDRSGTRKEELIYHPDEMLRVYGLRRAMQGIPPVEAMDMFIQRLKKTKTNTEFLLSLNR